jgi:hypothetical protein
MHAINIGVNRRIRKILSKTTSLFPATLWCHGVTTPTPNDTYYRNTLPTMNLVLFDFRSSLLAARSCHAGPGALSRGLTLLYASHAIRLHLEARQRTSGRQRHFGAEQKLIANGLGDAFR